MLSMPPARAATKYAAISGRPCIRYVKKWNIYFSIAFHYASYLILCFLLLIIYLLNFNLE